MCKCKWEAELPFHMKKRPDKYDHLCKNSVVKFLIQNVKIIKCCLVGRWNETLADCDCIGMLEIKWLDLKIHEEFFIGFKYC